MAARPVLDRITRRRWPAVITFALLVIVAVLVEARRAIYQRPAEFTPTADVRELDARQPEFQRTLELLTGIRVDPGNRVDELLNGNATYPRLLRDLASARQAIAMQMYYALPGRVADTIARVLCDRARAGVRTLLLLDAFGSGSMAGRWADDLRRCGVDVAFLRKLQWYTLHNATDRSHVRAVIVDGRIGYTGGFGIADYWLGDGHTPEQWRETNVRFEGPAVAALQAAFDTGWEEATGELIIGPPFFPKIELANLDTNGGVRAGLLFTAPTIGSTAAERFLVLAIRTARSRLYISNSYFVPGRAFRRLLIDAVARGVDVRVLTVSSNTDVKTPWLAGRSFYDELTAHGVKVYEYQPTMMHAKTMVIDSRWATIGSMNFDNRSLAFNDESNLIVLDSAFGAKMDSVFFDDLRYAKEMTADQLRRRPWWEHVIERAAALLTRVL